MVEKKLKAIKEKQTQSQIIQTLAEECGLTKQQIKDVLEALRDLVFRHVMRRGSGEFKIPFLGVKIMRKVKPATKRRTGRNPATGEEVIIDAKPKREVVKLSVLKVLKEILETK